jgi:hypothetical protein
MTRQFLLFVFVGRTGEKKWKNKKTYNKRKEGKDNHKVRT